MRLLILVCLYGNNFVTKMVSIKKIALFGGTGMTGVCALDYAVSSGLKVRALLRPSSVLSSDLADKIEIVRGDVLNEADVKETISGTDGVVVVLGTRNDVSPTTMMSTGMTNILKAMNELGVKPLSVCLSSFLFLPPNVVPPVFKFINEEHKRMLDAVEKSGTNWVAVFPPHIADEPSSEYKVEENKLPGRRVVSKRDLGKFLVSSISDPNFYGKKLGISSAEPQ